MSLRVSRKLSNAITRNKMILPDANIWIITQQQKKLPTFVLLNIFKQLMLSLKLRYQIIVKTFVG